MSVSTSTPPEVGCGAGLSLTNTPRRRVSSVGAPRLDIVCCIRSAWVSSSLPFTATIISPDVMPACCAGELGATPVTTTVPFMASCGSANITANTISGNSRFTNDPAQSTTTRLMTLC